MGSAYPCPSPTNSPLVRHEELSQAALMFTGDNSDFMAPVTIFSSGDTEEWKSWIYPEYIVPELQVGDDFFILPLAPIDDAALSVLLTDHYVYTAQSAVAEGGMPVDEVVPLSGDMVDDSLLVPAEPLLSTDMSAHVLVASRAHIGFVPDNAVSEVVPSVVAARVPLLEVNFNLDEPDVLTCSKLDPTPPIIRDRPEISLSHGTESSPVPSTATGAVRGSKSTRAARHGDAVRAQPVRRSSRVAVMTSTVMTMTTVTDVPRVQHKHVCNHENCNRSFPGAYEFVRHQRTHLPPSLFCGVCKIAVMGDRPDALRRHQRETERCKTLQRRLTDERLQELGCITREERRMSLATEDWLD